MAFRFPDLKAPAEHKTLTFDFTAELSTGVTITSAAMTYAVASGTESPVTLANNGAGALDATSKKWLQPVLGGIDGVEYNCTCTATLSSGSTPSILTGILGVRDPIALWPTTYPSDLALTTVDALGNYLDPPTSGNRSDFLLRDLIKRASAVILANANLDVCYSAAQTETRNGNGKDRIVAKVTPITAVTSVTIDGVTVPAATSTIGSGYVFDDQMIYLRGYVFTQGYRNVVLSYAGGVAAGSQVASALEQACLVTCALWWKRRAHIDQVSLSAPSGIGSTSFLQVDIPKEAQTIINQFKRGAPGTP